MTLSGSAFLALWNDVDPARDAEYNCWHTFEHVPERVGVDGFLSGRRYVARERSEDRYFTLYELDALSTLDGPAYTDVVDRPTEWSRSMRPSLRNFLRCPCRTVLTMGAGTAASIATLRFGVGPATSDVDAGTAGSVLQPFLEFTGVTSLHLGRAHKSSAFPIPNGTSSAFGERGAQHVLLVEGIDRTALQAAARRIAEAIERGIAAVPPVVCNVFDLAFVIERSGLRQPAVKRQPARGDLRGRFG